MFKAIKWLIKTILMLTGILPLFKCGSGYKENNGKVFFNGKEITDKSFVVLSDAFAKDSVAVYYKEKSIGDADVATFEVVDDNYAKDKNRVYYCDEFREGQNYYLTKRQVIAVLKNALPASFVSLENGYAKDAAHAFFEGDAFPVKDVSSFVSINRAFAKDAVQAYLNLQPIAGSHGATFEIIGDNYAKDEAHIYYYGYTGQRNHDIHPIPCDRKTFEILDYRYAKDQTAVFYLGQKINGVDGASFKMLGGDYSKDRTAVYFGTQKVAGADAATFEVYPDNELYGHDFCFAKDGTSVFLDDKKVSEADVATFKVLGENYGSDHQHVFYTTKIVKGADPATFKVYPHDFGNADSEDAQNKYHEGKKVVDE